MTYQDNGVPVVVEGRTRNLNHAEDCLAKALLEMERIRIDIQKLVPFFTIGMKSEAQINRAGVDAKQLCLAARVLACDFDNCADALIPGIRTKETR